MVITALPFDYVNLIDKGDRIRRTSARASETRIRRASGRGEG
jgi:hypothetical protein